MKCLPISIFLLCTCAGYAQTTITIHFESGKYTLTASARMSLDSFLLTEKENLSTAIFHVHGYCDAIGSDSFNDRLSANRVMTVKKYLLAKGILPAGIGEERAHGEKDPLTGNTTEEGRRLNRRVEISLVKVAPTYLQKNEPVRSLAEKIADTATKAGTTIALNNINFYGGSPLPLPESFATLDELLEIMRVNYSLVIEIRGHICCVTYPGDIEYRSTGNGLSEERARTVYAHLVGNGIEASRVSYKGFGHSLPIYPYPEKTEEERTANRRVEIKIISK
jgi:outer membrane protein OmpA-like peptidoglycan-associated protein